MSSGGYWKRFWYICTESLVLLSIFGPNLWPRFLYICTVLIHLLVCCGLFWYLRCAVRCVYVRMYVHACVCVRMIGYVVVCVFCSFSLTWSLLSGLVWKLLLLGSLSLLPFFVSLSDWFGPLFVLSVTTTLLLHLSSFSCPIFTSISFSLIFIFSPFLSSGYRGQAGWGLTAPGVGKENWPPFFPQRVQSLYLDTILIFLTFLSLWLLITTASKDGKALFCRDAS